jgi:AcrR family transcriptional regulator
VKNINLQSDQNIKKKIQQSALLLFQERGYAGTTMVQIAQQAGVASSLIYRYFTGKRDLFDSLHHPELDFPDAAEQRKRQDILRVAGRIFGQKGYSAATMEEIAAALHLSKPALYFYYSSKQDLFGALLSQPIGFVRLQPLMQQLAPASGISLSAALEEIAFAYLSLFQDPEFVPLMQMIISEGVHEPAVREIFTQQIIERGSEMTARFLQTFSSVEKDTARSAALIFFQSLFSWGLVNVLFSEYSNWQVEELRQVAHQLTQHFLYGYQGGRS